VPKTARKEEEKKSGKKKKNKEEGKRSHVFLSRFLLSSGEDGGKRGNTYGRKSQRGVLTLPSEKGVKISATIQKTKKKKKKKKKKKTSTKFTGEGC